MERSEPTPPPARPKSVETPTMSTGALDREQRDCLPPNFEQIMFTIKRLQCDSCDIAISKAINQIRSIRTFHINIILARLRIELDTNQASAKETAEKLKTATGYIFEEYNLPQGPVLDLLVNDAEVFCQTHGPNGVIEIEPIGKHAWDEYRILSRCGSASNLVAVPSNQFLGAEKINSLFPTSAYSIYGKQKGVCSDQKTVRIHYNAKEVGARDLVSFYTALCPSQNIRLAHASPGLAAADIDTMQTKRSLVLILVASALVVPVNLLDWAPVDHKNPLYGHISIGLASILQIIIILEILPGTFRILIHSMTLHMNILPGLSTTCAYALSLASYVLRLRGQPLQRSSYTATFSCIASLALLGRLQRQTTMHTAARMMCFRLLQVGKVHRLISGNTIAIPSTKATAIQLLQYGDHFVVPPNTRIATDGRVVSGGSEVSEFMINGESIPVAKGHGSTVYAGSLNGSGRLVVKLSALPYENTVSRIAAGLESVKLGKFKTYLMTHYSIMAFVPLVTFMSATVFISWMMILRYLNHQSWINAAVTAFNASITMIVVSCPHAIALAAPIVVLMASSISAQHSIVIRDTQRLLVANSVTDIVFSKTGALTCGVFTVRKAEYHDNDSTEINQILYELFHDAQSSIALAMIEWLRQQGMDNKKLGQSDIEDIKEIPGKGVEATLTKDSIRVRVGSPRWLGIDEVESNHTLICVEISGMHAATFRLQDQVRMTARSVVKRLQKRDIKVHLTSSANEGATKAVAFALELPYSTTHHSFGPDRKSAYVRNLQRQGKVVMFVGDAANDAESLTQADIGIHMNHNSSARIPFAMDDVVNKAADVIIMDPSKLHAIMVLLDISASVKRRITFNFIWAGVYNATAVLMAAGVLGKYRIPPALAGLGPLIAFQPVMLAGMLMRHVDFGKRYRKEERQARHEMGE